MTADPWWLLSDVCKVLGIRNHRNAAGTLDDDERDAAHLLDAIGRSQQTTIINEPGLYRVIMVSRKPDARRFKKWIVGEVLPSIRKTGGYGNADPMAALNDPAVMRTLLLTYSERVLSLETDNAALTPKAEALDRLAASDGSLCITDAAKALQIQPRALFRWLREEGWIYSRPGTSVIAYQHRIQTGTLEHKVTTVQRQDGTEKTVTQVRVTPQGAYQFGADLGRPPAGSIPTMWIASGLPT